jgi:hypothetical protein
VTVERLIDVIRAAEGDGDAGDNGALADATQLRLRRSLETGARSRHQLVGLVTAIAILCGGTMSWALVGGHVATLWAPAPEPVLHRPTPVEIPPPLPHRPHRPHQGLIAPPRPDLPPETVPPPAPAAPPAPPEPAAPPRPPPPPASSPSTRSTSGAPARPRRPISPPAVEALYRRAHDLHFHGGDPAFALAAWDAYLAAEPHGRFSVEARYNRALVLIRLGRYADARAALGPFARGEIAPAGYRQAEAEQLVERLARYK